VLLAATAFLAKGECSGEECIVDNKGGEDLTTTPITLFERHVDVDFVSLTKGGFRNTKWFLPLLMTEYTFDLSAYPSISRVLLYTSHRIDCVEELTFKVDGEDAVLNFLGPANGDCWEGKKAYAYYVDKSYDCDSSPTQLVISEICDMSILNGFSLMVFYDDGDDSNNRDITIVHGNDVNFGADSPSRWGWNVDIFVSPEAQSDVIAEFHISDVEYKNSEYYGSIFLNGVEVSSETINPLTPDSLPAKSSEYWDRHTFDIPNIVDGQINNVFSSCSQFVETEDDAAAVATQDCQLLIAVVLSSPTWVA